MCIKKTLIISGLITGFAMSNIAYASYATSDAIGGDITRIFGVDSKVFPDGVIDDNQDLFLEAGSGNITLTGAHKYIPAGWNGTFDSGAGGSSSLFNVFQDDSVSDPAIPSSNARGRFEVSSEAWNQFSNIAIGLKVGENLNWDWAIFELEQFASDGFWFASPKQGASLSHFLVYTKPAGQPAPPVPIPSAFWLLGTSLLGMIGISRKKPVTA